MSHGYPLVREGDTNSDFFNVKIDTTGLKPGPYEGSITIKSRIKTEHCNVHLLVNDKTGTGTANPTPGLTIDKTASAEVYSAADDVITYTFTVTNSGNVDITGPITVTDDKLGTLEIPSETLTPGSSVSGTATYNITQDDINVGSVKNIAYATGTFNSQIVTSNNADATVTAIQNPALTIEKSADPTTYSTVDDVITYTYKVTSSGNVPIRGPIMVSDNKINEGRPFQISAEGLRVGASTIGTATYRTISAGSVTNTTYSTETYNSKEVKSNSAGSVTNTVYATGTYNSKEVKSNTDTATVTFKEKPVLKGSDLIVTSMNVIGDATVKDVRRNTDESIFKYYIAVPLRVAIKNQDEEAAGIFNVSIEVLEEMDVTGLHYRFIVPGKNNYLDPSTDAPLNPGEEIAFDGEVLIHNMSNGKTVFIKAIADSCSGDEFMPAYCRVNESNEGNNNSPLVEVNLPYFYL